MDEGQLAAELEEARLAREATAAIAGLLAEKGMNRTQLAERLGVSPGRVSQILSGGGNLTLRSLAAIARALDARVEIQFFGLPQAGQSSPPTDAPHPGPQPYVPSHS